MSPALSPSFDSSREGMSNQTLDAFAKALGTTRRSILRWEEKFRDAPKVREEGPWRAFMQAKALGPYGCRTGYRGDAPAPQTAPPVSTTAPAPAPAPQTAAQITPAGATLAEAKARVELARAEQMERQNAEAVGRLVEREPLNIVLGDVLQGMAFAIDRFPHVSARFLRGLRTEEEVAEKLHEELFSLSAVISDTSGSMQIDSDRRELVAALQIAPPPGMADSDFRNLALSILRETAAIMGDRFLAKITHARSTREATFAALEEVQNDDPAEDWRPPSMRARDALLTTAPSHEDLATANPAPEDPKRSRVGSQSGGGNLPPKRRVRKPRPRPAAAPAEIEAAILTTPRIKRK